MKKQLICGITAALLLTPVLRAQMPPGMEPAAAAKKSAPEKLYSQSFADTPLDMLVDFYNEWTGRTLIVQADLSARITLKFSKLTKDEAMQAIETILSMNGVALVPMGDKFLKVVPIASARQEGMEIRPFDEETDFVAADQLISQIIPLRYVIFSDVQPVVQHLIHGYGKVISLERINSVLVTDTSANVARIVEALELLDQPLEKIEPRIYQLNHAKAGDIAGKLKELVEAAQPESSAKQQVVANARTIPGVIRAPKTTTAVVAGGASTDDTQMVQGNVKFVSDERTNILIVFSKAANFDFFDRIIKVLDVPVDPEVVVETINLEYAEASEIAGILNDFIGAAQAEEETTKAQTGDNTESGESRNINDVIARRTGNAQRQVNPTTESAIGRLSADTKIISDERTNSLILMGSKSDINALKTVIASLDMMLQQVVIEAVILTVNVGDTFATGVDWVYEKGGFGGPVRRSFGPSLASGIATNVLDAAVKGATFQYYQTLPSLDTEVLIQAAKTDSDTRILSTPIVLTTDNTEAKITVAKEQPVVTSSINSGTTANNSISARATYEYKTIGVELTVTPYINPEGFVLMEITQSADEIDGTTNIDGNDVPIVSKREISATVGVKNEETVILGGLVRKSDSESATKIPILGDIPILGWFFNSRSNSDDREELIVLLTPYVLNTPQEAHAETTRRFESADSQTTEWPRGWSLSDLANDEPSPDAWKNKDEQE